MPIRRHATRSPARGADQRYRYWPEVLRVAPSDLRVAVDGLIFEDVLAHYQLLFASRTCLLLDRPFYKYRINHPGRITDKKDRDILTIFEVLRRSQDTLRAHGATESTSGCR